MTKQFKPGDRVRCLGNATKQFTKGNIYTVKDVRAGIDVVVERDDSGSTNNGWHSSYFELAPEVEHAQPPKPFIVSRRNFDGTFSPSGNPFVHLTKQAAEAEAKRLARLHGGDFVVFEGVARASRPEVVIPPVTLTAL